VVNATLRPLYPSGRATVPIIEEAGWAPRSVWTEEDKNFLSPQGLMQVHYTFNLIYGTFDVLTAVRLKVQVL